MLPQLAPLALGGVLQKRQIDGDDRTDVMGLDLADVCGAHITDGELLDRAGHAGLVEGPIEDLPVLVLPEANGTAGQEGIA